MFGYILANQDTLSQEENQRYRSCYCGLCHAIKDECSSLSRLALNYDMTFLVLLLSSLYEPEESQNASRCIARPQKKQAFWVNNISAYCARMNVALAYYNCMDDWHDDGSLLKRGEAQLFRSARDAMQHHNPRQAAAIVRCLDDLSAIEKKGVADADGAANCFGRLMGELFVMDEQDRWAETLRNMGHSIGCFIYVLDAVCDLEDDLKKGHYNPLASLSSSGTHPKDYENYLTLFIADATAEFEKLPLVQDLSILRNILYSGVWTKYHVAIGKKVKQQKEQNNDL